MLPLSAGSPVSMYTEQEQVIDAFMAFAADLGYEFNFQEFMEYMYTHAEEVK